MKIKSPHNAKSDFGEFLDEADTALPEPLRVHNS